MVMARRRPRITARRREMRLSTFGRYSTRVEFVISDDGASLAIEILGRGSAAPALVLPGGPCREPTYLGDMGGLADARPLAVLHPRGTPASGGLSRGWWNDAADVIAAADHLGIEQIDIVAHSAGTRLALAATVQYANRIRSLALVTPAAQWLTDTTHDGRQIAARREEPEIALAIGSMDGPEPQDAESFLRSLSEQAPAGYARWTTIEQAHAREGSWSWEASSAWFRDIPANVVTEVQHSAIPPAFVLGGVEDILSGVDPVRAYASSLGARLELLDECGHYPWVEQPTGFRSAMENWFATTR